MPQVQTGQASLRSSDFIIYLISYFKDRYFILETANYIKQNKQENIKKIHLGLTNFRRVRKISKDDY